LLLTEFQLISGKLLQFIYPGKLTWKKNGCVAPCLVLSCQLPG